MGKYKKLALSIVLDAIGFITIFDVIWAPLSAYIMTKMYPGNKGKVAGVMSFIEEILPGLDIIPTFTIMWFYTYVFSKNEDSVIEVKG
jgi:predicted transglutaminase-like protease